MALLEELRLAFELGCQDEYILCIHLWAKDIALEQGVEVAQQFIHENELAYRLVADELQRQQDGYHRDLQEEILSAQNRVSQREHVA